MKYTLITVGSRGDAEPFCALAQALSDDGHHVDLWLQTDMQHLAPPQPNKIALRKLPFTCTDFYKYMAPDTNPGKDHPNPRVQFTGIVAVTCSELVLPCTKQVLEVASSTNEESIQPSVIIASSLARHLAMVVSIKLDNTPLCLVQLQPLVPTKDFPHSSQTEKFIQAIVSNDKSTGDPKNVETYLELEEFQYKFVQKRWESTCIELGVAERVIPTWEDMKGILQGQNARVVLINAFSDQLIPQCSDHHHNDQVWNIGALADDYIPKGWKPPQNLVDFLNASEAKPICVGYGSMPFEKTEMLLEVIRQTNERFVLVGSAMLDVEHDDRVFVVKSVPYPYLLPRCSMMLSHGGAGVVHATLRAGIPSVISPLLGDQFFYAKLLEAKGLGVEASSLPNVSLDVLVSSIQKARDCTAECEKVGKLIGQTLEGGAKKLAKALQERFDP